MLRAFQMTGACALLAVSAARAAAQEFIPPDRGGRPTSTPAQQPPPPASASGSGGGGGFGIGIFGFSTRGGMQVNKGSQGVIGSTLDVMQLGTPLVRVRPSFEMGFGNSTKSVAASAEVVYRFQPDQAPAIPYLGLGVGYYDDSTMTRVWPTVVMGFELAFRRNINWLVEYHALDGLRRSRFFVGLATRGLN